MYHFDHMENAVTTLDNTPKPPIKRSRRITKADAEAIADLVSDQITESEACHLLKIVPKQWFNWKGLRKNDSEFSALITRIRAAKIKGLISEVRKAATGSNGVRHDWRAAQALLAVTAPDRYSQRSGEHQSTVTAPAISPERIKVLLQVIEQRDAAESAKLVGGGSTIEALPSPTPTPAVEVEAVPADDQPKDCKPANAEDNPD
jgi:hypothetical protein